MQAAHFPVSEGLLRRTIIGAVAALSILGAVPVLAPASAPAGKPSIVYKSCSSGWRNAVINGSHKCLRRGQFCARRSDRQYHRYGFHCHRYDRRVERYRLT
jgi:hypothetical protein